MDGEFKIGDIVEYIEIDFDELCEYAQEYTDEDGEGGPDTFSDYYGYQGKVVQLSGNMTLVKFEAHKRTRELWLYNIELRFIKNRSSHFPDWF